MADANEGQEDPLLQVFGSSDVSHLWHCSVVSENGRPALHSKVSQGPSNESITSSADTVIP
jgi:hypothetical protein